jgi:hypothetical protein
MPYEFVVRYEPRFGPLLRDGRKRQTIRKAVKHGDRSPDIGDVFVHTVEHSPTKLELIGDQRSRPSCPSHLMCGAAASRSVGIA